MSLIVNYKRFILLVIFVAFSYAFTSGLYAEALTPEILLNSALESNPELQKLNIESRQADIDLKNAKASMLPSVDFQTSLSWMSKPLIEPISLTAGQLGSYDAAGTTILLPVEDMIIYKGMENTFYEFKFIVDQPIYTWGKLTNAVKLYGKAAETSDLIIESKRNEIKTKINIYFYTLHFITEIESQLKLQVIDALRMINIADESYKNGFLLYTDLLKARIQAKELAIAEVKLNEQKEEAMLVLSQLSGIKELSADSFDFTIIKNIEDIKIRGIDGYLDSALKRSPELKMLNILRVINELQIEIKKGSMNFKPDIGLHLELGYSGPRFPFIEIDWFGQDSLGLTSTIALQTTIYEGGKQQLNIERGIEELEKSYYEYESGLDSLRHLITESILKLDLNRQNIEYYRLLQENDKQQIEIKQTQLEAGSGSETDMLEEKINMNIHMIEEYSETIDFFKNYFTLLGASSSMQ